jgi:hypothetical protein
VADIVDDILGEERLVRQDRTDVVVAGNVGRRDESDDARHGERLRRIDTLQLAMRHRRNDQRRMQRAGQFGHVVDIGRLAGDLLGGAVMGDARGRPRRAGRF